ncbi:MAG: DUF4091 domain-containing protein [Bacteroidales bacterium]|nr:DUF4091 domain-containing protein [Bacteroidales bacterium]
MKFLIYYLLPLILLTSNGCNNRAIDKESITEAGDPMVVDPEVWSSVDEGLNSGFGSTDIRYSRSIPPKGDIKTEISLTGWKGEKVHCQLLFWSVSDQDTIRVISENNGANDLVPGKDIIFSTVKYVLADEFLNGCGYRNKDTIASYLVPDMLDDTSSFNLPGMQTRPVWISIDIPSGIEPGIHDILITATSYYDTINHSIHLEVQDKILPPPDSWSFHLDLWQNPFAVARYHNVQLWSEEHMNLLKPLLTMLAEAGQKCITTSITHKPWGGQTYDPFESMITWLKSSDGFWEYDYSVFDQYVQLAIDCGITEQINCYSMVPWCNKYSWYDQDSGKFITGEAIPGSIEYMNIWKPFLNDFRVHLMEMGWLEKTTIAMDERGEEEMKKMFGFLDEEAPDFRVSLAGRYFEDINRYIYDFSYNWRHITAGTKRVTSERKDSGNISTYYVACGIPSPNTFTFSPPAEAAYLGWFAAAMGFDGFLRWAYNSWPENPVYDSRFIKWPSGDTYLVYPGARSSIRFEKLIEGIQDYEKIRILKKELLLNPSMEAAAAEIRLQEFLSSINTDFPDSLMAKDIVSEGKKILEEISRIR